MDSHLSESLEIVDSFDFVRSDRKADFKKELGKRVKDIKTQKKFKKLKEKQVKKLKEKHGLNQVYTEKFIRIEKFNATKRRQKNIEALKKTQTPCDLEKWCKLTGSKYLKKTEERSQEEEETAFDDSFFEEFSKDFLGVPEQRKQKH